MEKYQYCFTPSNRLPIMQTIKVGAAGSGNLEVEISPIQNEKTCFIIHTTIAGYQKTWKAVIERFIKDYPYSYLKYTIYDAGAAPAVVALRLRQAIETYQFGYHLAHTYTEMNARQRIFALLDKGTFQEFLLEEDCHSLNLSALGMQTQTDDGVVIGVGKLQDNHIAIVSQQKDFIGGAVGEIHGAKCIGLIRYAIQHQLSAIIFLIDSGGVRLQEANVGEIEISEMIEAIFDARVAGIKTIGVICSENGAYGGMGIVSGALDYRIVNRTARIGVSGADVIQTVKGIESFNASDRPLVWRVYGGRTRYLQKAADAYVTNQVADIKKGILLGFSQLDKAHLLTPERVLKNHQRLTKRLSEAQNYTEEGSLLNDIDKAKYENLFDIDDLAFLKMANILGDT